MTDGCCFNYDLTRLFVLKKMKKKGGGSDFPVNMKSQGPWCQTEVKATSVTTLL